MPRSEAFIKTDMVPVRVLLADDQPRLFAQIALILGNTHEIVGTVGHGRELVEAAARLDPDVIVSDISMPGVGGFAALRELKRSGSRSRFVFLTVHDDPDFVREALCLGADAYVVKSRLASDLPEAIRAAREGRVFVSPSARLGLEPILNGREPEESR